MSGVQRFSLYLLDGLDKAEYEIWVACKPGGEFVDEIKARGYHYLPLPSFRHPLSILDAITFLHLLHIMFRQRFDIVHTNSSKPGFLGRLAARIAGVPLILHTAHGVPFQNGQHPLQYLVYSFLEGMGNLLGHKTIYVNNSDRLTCLKLGLIKEKKAISIFNALPEAQSKLLGDFASKRQAAANEFIIGSTIRFSQQKNAINLVTAACKACLLSEKLRFVILGDGEHYELCKAIVKSYKVDNRVLLPGWDSDTLPWLKVFNAFVLYSRWEAMPFSIIEAMSAALPVIGSDIPSIAELVNEDCGCLVPLDDEKALIASFLALVSDPELAFSKGQNALNRINTICSYPQMVSSYDRIYQQEPSS
ncbi:MAG: glycosyltransferase [Candidatus Cloacimonetes bacterium]|nr:glycosyltransferase [Candidatus Cloacimonadota bacterium]